MGDSLSVFLPGARFAPGSTTTYTLTDLPPGLTWSASDRRLSGTIPYEWKAHNTTYKATSGGQSITHTWSWYPERGDSTATSLSIWDNRATEGILLRVHTSSTNWKTYPTGSGNNTAQILTVKNPGTTGAVVDDATGDTATFLSADLDNMSFRELHNFDDDDAWQTPNEIYMYLQREDIAGQPDWDADDSWNNYRVLIRRQTELSGTAFASGLSYTHSTEVRTSKEVLEDDGGILTDGTTTVQMLEIVIIDTGNSNVSLSNQTTYNDLETEAPASTVALPDIDDQTLVKGTSYTITLPEANYGEGTKTYTLTGLPAGMSFNANTRKVTGEPTATTGTYTVTYSVTDTTGTATKTAIYRVTNPPLEWADTNPTLGTPTLENGTAYTSSAMPAVTAGTSPYSYTMTGLPAGLSFNSTTRVVSGTPSSSGSSVLTYTASDAGGSSLELTATWTVGSQELSLGNATLNAQSLTKGTAVSIDLSSIVPVTGVPPYAYSMTGLPAGLSFNTSTRVVSGTPTTTGNYSVGFVVSDALNRNQSLSALWSVSNPALSFANGAALNIPQLTQDSAMTSQTMPAASGGTGTITYSMTDLPAGLSFNASTRVLSGTPTSTGTTTVTYTATDSASATISLTQSVTVSAAAATVNLFDADVATEQGGIYSKVTVTPNSNVGSNTYKLSYTTANWNGDSSLDLPLRNDKATGYAQGMFVNMVFYASTASLYFNSDHVGISGSNFTDIYIGFRHANKFCIVQMDTATSWQSNYYGMDHAFTDSSEDNLTRIEFVTHVGENKTENTDIIIFKYSSTVIDPATWDLK